jgi:hypothetical protein
MEYFIGATLLFVLLLLLRILNVLNSIQTPTDFDEKKVLLSLEKLDARLNSIAYDIHEIKNKEYNERNRNWSNDDLP